MLRSVTCFFIASGFLISSSDAFAAKWPKSVEKAREVIEKTDKWCNVPHAKHPFYGKITLSCMAPVPTLASTKGFVGGCNSSYDLNDDGTLTNIRVICDYKQIDDKAVKPQRAEIITTLFEHGVYKALRETRYVTSANNPVGFSRQNITRGFSYRTMGKDGKQNKTEKPDDSRLIGLPLYTDKVSSTSKKK